MTPPQIHLSPRRSEGTAWLVALEQADHRLAKPHNMLKTCNGVDNLVYEPGVTGHKSELMMSPASRPA